ncbi:hypothetical protein QLQ12_43395 [Actinoplanes sp. NEAU-A12]|uniref:AB hydrolase-1 domain-containing protein n=1 Tax=Actinoplanes sandaracinus TaxID=3045177 RepID=A0ABT6X0C0_9ACTN|nr:hypothetical protein [Actinoplanes sandaracinus]MDI6105450.1 hypothetical protein [Actinoplanes sandaracinus]
MAGSLLFVHGTGAHGTSGTLKRLRDGMGAHPVLSGVAVSASRWGEAVGPADLDVASALPPDIAARALGEEPADAEVTAAEWDLLAADPMLELRLLAALAGTDTGSRPILVAVDSADVVVYERLTGLTLPSEALAAAGVDDAEVTSAAAFVAAQPETTEAAGAVADPDDDELVTALARAVVATMLQSRGSAARQAFVDAVKAGLAPAGTRGIGTKLVGKVLRPLATRLATRVAMRRRGALMDPTTDFIRDIAFYIRRGEVVREHLVGELAALAPPVVVLGHSLGGIAAVDLLSAPDRPSGVRLLVTAGSQAPYLYLLDALDRLRPGGAAAPFTPWLNVYDRADLLSFCAARVFPAIGIRDEPVDAGVPFPDAHSAYWEQPRLYELIAEHWPSS